MPAPIGSSPFTNINLVSAPWFSKVKVRFKILRQTPSYNSFAFVVPYDQATGQVILFNDPEKFWYSTVPQTPPTSSSNLAQQLAWRDAHWTAKMPFMLGSRDNSLATYVSPTDPVYYDATLYGGFAYKMCGWFTPKARYNQITGVYLPSNLENYDGLQHVVGVSSNNTFYFNDPGAQYGDTFNITEWGALAGTTASPIPGLTPMDDDFDDLIVQWSILDNGAFTPTINPVFPAI